MFIYSKISNKKTIRRYTIYGERHSGTKLIQNIINAKTTLQLTWEYGWKHWFGFADKKQILNDSETIFICMVRNPIDWILSFYNDPHHVPRDNTKSLNTFLFNEWYSIIDPIFNTTEIYEDRNFLTYKRYHNIFDMRLHKMYYLRQVLPLVCNNVIMLKYEDLLLRPKLTINSILDLLPAHNTHKNHQTIIKPIKSYICDKDISNIIKSNIDWNIENTIAYEYERF